MSIDNIAKLIVDYGVTLILVAIFIYIIIRVVNIAFNIAENKISNAKHDQRLELRNEMSTKIQYMITDFLEKHDGRRVQVIEFSNSVMSIAYLPFKYMTCTYEAYIPELRSSGRYIDKISTSLLTTFFDKLQDEDVFEVDVHNYDELHKVGGAMCDLMHDIDEDTCICMLMKSVKGTPVGYVSFFKDGNYTEDDIQDLKTLASSISIMLCVVQDRYSTLGFSKKDK